MLPVRGYKGATPGATLGETKPGINWESEQENKKTCARCQRLITLATRARWFWPFDTRRAFARTHLTVGSRNGFQIKGDR